MGFRDGTRGNLLAIGALALAVLLVVSSLTFATGGRSDTSVSPDAASHVTLIERGIESELDNSSLGSTRNTTSNRTFSINPSRPRAQRSDGGEPSAGLATQSAVIAQRAVENTFDGAVDRATRQRVSALLVSIARQQRDSGEMTMIEPSDAGVQYGIEVTLGTPNGSSTSSVPFDVGSRTATRRTVDQRRRNETRASSTRPGPGWTRQEKLGTTAVVLDSQIATSPPGEGWNRVRVVSAQNATYEWTTNVTSPGPRWTRQSPNGSKAIVTNTTVAAESPGPHWQRLADAGTRRALYRYQTSHTRPGSNWTRVETLGSVRKVTDITNAAERPSPAWTSVNQTDAEYLEETTASPAAARYVRIKNVTNYRWRLTLRPKVSLERYGRTVNRTVYDWRRQTSEPISLSLYEKTETRPVYRWSRTRTVSITDWERVTIPSRNMASTDAPQRLLGSANGIRDSSLTFVSNTLPVGVANATLLRAVPEGADPTVATSSDWTMRIYRTVNGTTVVEVENETVRTTEPTTEVDLGDVTIDGNRIDGARLGTRFPEKFDLYLIDGSDVYGSYSLFATNPATTEMRTVENVSVTRAIQSATFDVTYQDRRTTYTDTVTIRPDHDLGGSVTVINPDEESPEPPRADFEVTEQSRNNTHVVYQLNASATTSDALITTYRWNASAHRRRLDGLQNGQVTQTVAVERASESIYVPLRLTVVDENGLHDSVEHGIAVPGTVESSLSSNADLSVTGMNDTYAKVRAQPVDHARSDEWSYDWHVVDGREQITETERRNGSRTVLYTVERRPRATTVAAELNLTDPTTGVWDTDIDDATIPALPSSETAPLNVSLSEQSRTRTEVTYRVSARGNDNGSLSWDALSYSARVTGLDDGTPKQTFTARRSASDYTLTIEGTEVRDDGTTSDAASTTVPAEIGAPTSRGPAAVVRKHQTGGDTGAETWTLDGSWSSPTSRITGYEWTVLDDSQSVTVDKDRDSKYRLSIDRPDSGRRAVPVRLTVTDKDGQTDSTRATIVVDATSSGDIDSLVDPTAALDTKLDTASGTRLTFSLDARASEDVDGHIVDYRYRVSGNVHVVEAPTDGRAQTALVIEKDSPDSKANVTLTVEDDDGLTSSVTKSLVLSKRTVNAAPNASMTLVQSSRINRTLREYSLNATNSTDRDGQVSQIEYDLLVENGELLGSIQDGTSTQTLRVKLSKKNPDLRIELTVTDDDGATDSAVANVSQDPVIDHKTPPEIVQARVTPSIPTVGETGTVSVRTDQPVPVTVYIDGAFIGTTRTEPLISNRLIAGTVERSFRSGGMHSITLVATNSAGSDTYRLNVDVNRPPQIHSVSETGSSMYEATWLGGGDSWYDMGELQVETGDPDDDRYSVTVDSKKQPCYTMLGDRSCDTALPDRLSGTASFEAKIPLRERGVSHYGRDNVTITVTDEHGAAVTRNIELASTSDPDLDVTLFGMSETPAKGETISLANGETVPLDYGWTYDTAINLDQHEYEYELNVYGPDGTLVAHQADWVSEQNYELREQISPPDVIGSVGKPGEYTVRLNYRLGPKQGGWLATGGDTTTFTIERPTESASSSPSEPTETQWSTTDPGPVWISTGETREVEQTVESTWSTRGSEFGKFNDVSWIQTDTKTETTWATGRPGRTWLKTGNTKSLPLVTDSRVFQWETTKYRWEHVKTVQQLEWEKVPE